MSLQKRLVAVVALLLVIGLVVADLVTYASVRSFLYGRTDSSLAQDEGLAFNYLTFSSTHQTPLSVAALSRRVSMDVYVTVINRQGQVVVQRPSGSAAHPDPAPILTKGIPVQQVPDIYRRRGVHAGRYAGTFVPDPNAVVLGSTGDPDGQYRTIAVTVPQGTLITSLSLNPTNDTLNSLRKVEILASLAVLLAMGALVLVVVRRGLRPLRQMAGTADAIASGDLSRRVPEGRPGTEVGRLGSALNEMLGQIEVAFTEKSASEERLRQFVADASHELRTPLTSIRGYAELLSRGGFADHAGRSKALNRIEEEATRMGGLVEDLLLLAELDRGRPLRAEPVDLHRICADAVGDSNAVPHDHSLVLSPGGAVVVLGDDERLAQVAHNLVRNALAHTPAGTTVRVSTGVVEVEGMGYIEVADNGPGIPVAEAGRVFDRFYQADRSRTGGGTGLGLAIVRAIAEALGGSAEVVAGGGGGAGGAGGAAGAAGATLRVKVPLAATHVAAATARPSVPVTPSVGPSVPSASPQLH
ncbi:MAG TPA: ATP-binding protein [Acidimicrobiales bacterium]|nr:ATP-binding protein [Acidimicrobiales bacterium]